MRERRRGSGAAHERMCRRESGNTTLLWNKGHRSIEQPLEWSAALGGRFAYERVYNIGVSA